MKSLIALYLIISLPISALASASVQVQGFYQSSNSKYIFLHNGKEEITLVKKHLSKQELRAISKSKNIEIDLSLDPKSLKSIKASKAKKSTLKKIAAHKKRKKKYSKR